MHRWYWWDILGGVSLFKMTSPPPTFNLRITWMIIILDNSWVSEERTVRGSVSHIDAKYTRRKVKRLSDCSHFQYYVARESLVLIIGTIFFLFLLGTIDQTIFWYLELCLPTAVAVFYTLFATFTVMNHSGHNQKIIKRKKKKNAVQFSGNASSCSS